MAIRLGRYSLEPTAVLLVCGKCHFREPAEEARVGLDDELWHRFTETAPQDPPPAYRCRSCGRLRYVDESLEINLFDLVGSPDEPVKVACTERLDRRFSR